MPSADKINTPKKPHNQDAKPHTNPARQKFTDAAEMTALLGQTADLCDHARRGIDLAGLPISLSTIHEMLGYAREISKLLKKVEAP